MILKIYFGRLQYTHQKIFHHEVLATPLPFIRHTAAIRRSKYNYKCKCIRKRRISQLALGEQHTERKWAQSG
jgi:hypothetical protein